MFPDDHFDEFAHRAFPFPDFLADLIVQEGRLLLQEVKRVVRNALDGDAVQLCVARHLSLIHILAPFPGL